jgi:hypothetical protein
MAHGVSPLALDYGASGYAGRPRPAKKSIGPGRSVKNRPMAAGLMAFVSACRFAYGARREMGFRAFGAKK